ncbi:polysaccharide deacetylase family protein [Sphaerisporangium fuscum]|uniref:polysaccharide deacetylase family protein n=1 Tax=Sphaerisporangium fuscum TaxID=2835868 RepID=UPI001BDC7AE1|nr:polysaccharide deacetylase family protein [Sphaerisporangium fuscum]
MPRLFVFLGIALLVAISAGCGLPLPFTRDEQPTTLPAQPTTINFVDPTSVPGLAVRTVSSGDTPAGGQGDDFAGRHIFASYPVPPSTPALARKLSAVTAAFINAFARQTARRPATAPVPELNVGWHITAASGGVFGVRLRSGSDTGSGWHSSLSTYWYDTAARRVQDSAGLLKDRTALTTLAGLVKKHLSVLGPAMHVSVVKAEHALFDSLNFNPHGDLVVEFDDGQVAPARMGRIAVAVPKAQAVPLLSDLGRRAMEAVDSATPDRLPGRPPTMAAPTPWDGGAASRRGNGPGGEQTGGALDCSVTKCVALTFDDGPGPRTGRLLSVLAAHDAHATFFTVGATAEAYPGLLQRMAAEGHLVADHSWTHRDLTGLDAHEISEDLGRSQIAIGRATGYAPTLVRMPYGRADAKVSAEARRLGLSIVGWDLDAGDAAGDAPGTVAERVIDHVRPGSIVLMHDTGSTSTADALPQVLRTLTARGYTFVTVPELYGARGMAPGQVYTGGPGRG